MKLTPKKAQLVVALVIIFVFIGNSLLDHTHGVEQTAKLDRLSSQIQSGEVCITAPQRVQCALGNANALMGETVPLMMVQRIVLLAATKTSTELPGEKAKIQQQYYQLMSTFYSEKLRERYHRFDWRFVRLTTKNFDLISARQLLKELEIAPESAALSAPLREAIDHIQN